jgi:hypothetical protein
VWKRDFEAGRDIKLPNPKYCNSCTKSTGHANTDITCRPLYFQTKTIHRYFISNHQDKDIQVAVFWVVVLYVEVVDNNHSEDLAASTFRVKIEAARRHNPEYGDQKGCRKL